MANLIIKKLKTKNEFAGLVWILPAFALLLIFGYYPPISALAHSFTDWNGTTASFVGIDNFIRLFKDMLFYKSLGNMLILMIVCMVLGNLFTLVLAELLFNLKNKKVSSGYRFLFVLPALVPGIVTMLLWGKVIFTSEANGVANQIIALFGLGRSDWYYGESTVLLTMILTNFPWVAGTSFLIYLAGLQSVPESVIEASKLDGLGSFKRVWLIDLPLIKGQIKYFLVLGVIGGFQNYTLQYAITSGGPNNASLVPGYYMFVQALSYSEYGFACTIGFVLFIMILSITIINNRFFKSEEV